MTDFTDDTQKKGAVSDTAPIEPTKPLNSHDTTINNQHAICLRVLAISPQSTIDLRHTYGVMMPAARVKELRNMGYDIATVRVTETTPDNITHRGVAKYVLRHSPTQDNNQPNDKNCEVMV
jgi:Helix-turn-helix domain